MATYTNEDIIRYADDEMSLEEKQKMEEDLRSDPALVAEIELYRELQRTLQVRLPADEGAAALRQTMEGMRGKYFGDAADGGILGGGVDVGGLSGESGGGGAKVVKMKVRVDNFRKYMVGLAVAAAVLFAVVMLWPSDYLNTYGKTEMVSTMERGAGNDSVMEQASVFFNKGDFDKALPLLDYVFKADTSNQAALFYRGVALLHTEAMDPARADLLHVFAGSSVFKYEAAFYIALSYAQDKNKAAAKEWLGKIPAGAPGSDKAEELSKKVE